MKYRIRACKKDALDQDIAKADFYGGLYEKAVNHDGLVLFSITPFIFKPSNEHVKYDTCYPDQTTND